MKGLLALAALVVALSVFPTAASAASHVCGVKCWALALGDDTWLDPDENPIAGGVSGGVHGGDGATCSLADILDECDFAENPCAYYECNGDEGTGKVCYLDPWIVLCRPRHVSGHYFPDPPQTFVDDPSPITDWPTDYVQCPGTDTLEYDPDNAACWRA